MALPFSAPGDVGVPATLSIINDAPGPIIRSAGALGTHKSVADVTARNAIPSYVREEGMTAWVVSTSELYRLVGGILDTNWILEGGAGVGAVFTYLMGAGVALRDFVYQGGVADTANRADASALATGQAFGIVTSVNNPVAGSCQVVTEGLVGGFAGLVIGGRYLLGIAPGVIVLSTDVANINYPDNAGNVIMALGYAKAADTLYVSPKDYTIF